MTSEIPIITRCRIDDVLIDVCHGNIPDIFRKLWFDPLKEFELPDTKVTEKKFQRWLDLYRHASPDFEQQLLDVAKI